VGFGDGTTQQWVNVLVDYGGQPAEYTYAVPAHLAVQAGDILTVPFRHQSIGAIALALSPTPPSNLVESQIRLVEGVVEQRFFAPSYWALLQRVAQHYQVPLMQVIKAALPPGLLARSQRRIRLVDESSELAPALQGLLDDLRRSPTRDYTWQYLQRRGHSYRTLQQLIQLGAVESYRPHPPPAGDRRHPAPPGGRPVAQRCPTAVPDHQPHPQAFGPGGGGGDRPPRTAAGRNRTPAGPRSAQAPDHRSGRCAALYK
jgi:primosomal protein N' (replication factor Y)